MSERIAGKSIDECRSTAHASLTDPGHLKAHGRGAVSPYQEYREDSTVVDAYDVCCPGCGQETYFLDPDTYSFAGGKDHLTILEPITFVPCCGQTWQLEHGVWSRITLQ